MSYADFGAGFDSGNYDAAYVIQDESVETGLDRKREEAKRSAAWEYGYTLGFYSSHELLEVPRSTDRALLLVAIAYAEGKGLDTGREEG
jgi:hypothetical protein